MAKNLSSDSLHEVALPSQGGSAHPVIALYWREYLCEAFALGLFMVSASLFAILLFHPGSPLPGLVPSAEARRTMMGIAMGATAVTLILSPLGARSGAHMNPAVTLAFARLGRIRAIDTVFYIAFQFLGATVAMVVTATLLGPVIAHPDVGFVTTRPGAAGVGIAWLAEFLMSFTLLTVVLHVANHRRTNRATPWVAGALVAMFIALEAPLSGMSMNPARTFGSAFVAQSWDGFWIYVTAPLAAMAAAAELFLHGPGPGRAHCARLGNHGPHRCIFRCEHAALLSASESAR